MAEINITEMKTKVNIERKEDFCFRKDKPCKPK